MRILTIMLALILLAACAPVKRATTITAPPSEPTFLSPGEALPSPSGPTLDSNASAARAAMMTYFSSLNAGDYQRANDLYGGSYDTLISWNPDIQPSDRIKLWERACRQNGLQCLPVRDVISGEQISANVLKFMIQFRNLDGSLFVLGPCCGENETSMPPVSEFECDVARTSSGEFKVMCLPPYVP